MQILLGGVENQAVRRTPETNPRNISWSGSVVMCGSSLFHIRGAAIMNVLLYDIEPVRGLSSFTAAPRVDMVVVVE